MYKYICIHNMLYSIYSLYHYMYIVVIYILLYIYIYIHTHVSLYDFKSNEVGITLTLVL